MTPLDDDRAIERLALKVIDRTLPKTAWTHAAHFAAVLWLLRHRPGLTTPEAMRRLITGYNAATNTPNTDTGGYHHTITLASIRAASAHLSRYDPAEPTSVILHDLMRSPLGHRDWLLSYWSRDLLFGVDARRRWVDPDLANLPF
jgi:hypothetical protein